MRVTQANEGKSLTKSNHPVIFGLVAHFAPARMIAVLFASLRVAPGCLNMTLRIGANPYIGPRRRNAQFFNTLQLVGVANGLAIQPDIAEVFADTLTPYTRHGVGDV